MSTEEFRKLYPNVDLGNPGTKIVQERRRESTAHLYVCKHCNKQLQGLMRTQKRFCDHKCAALFNNTKRKVRLYNCTHCSKSFESKAHNPAKFCSLSCSSLHRKKTKIEVMCSCCQQLTLKSQAQIDRSVRQFCSNVCKNTFYRNTDLRGTIGEYNGVSGRATYRRKAFEQYERRCAVCNYEKFTEVLQVHHRDGNRKHNDISNLILLCPTCHIEVHRGLTDLPCVST